MNTTALAAVCCFVLVLTLCTPCLGAYLARVLDGAPPRWLWPLTALERWLYRLAGCDPTQEQRWTHYAAGLLLVNAAGLLVVLGLQLAQGWLPLNPQRLPGVPFALALNTAVSFATNTNWQAYSGEATLSYLTQMAGLGVQSFISAATGIAVLLALARGLVRRQAATIGNCWVDMVRATLYVLLPLAAALAVVLAAQGVVQSFRPYAAATTLEGAEQLVPLGPAASQVAIKQLGTNGGGFFGVNSAHPLENPTPLSNFLQLLAILLLPAAFTVAFGRLVGQRRHGWALYGAMLALFLAGLAVALWAEHGMAGHWEGKEARFGVTQSVLWATATTAASNGSVNAMHDSLSPLAGLVALVNMLLGEVVFGGVGAGLYGMVLFVLLTVFLAGLMVGRTPEYLGKQVGVREVTLALVAVLVPSAMVLLLGALALLTAAGTAGITNPGPHGLSQVLYGFASAANNNGSAFAGLGANAPFYHYATALAMLVGRYAVILPVLALAGRFAAKRVVPPSSGTFPTHGPLFAGLLIAVIVLVGALTFFPVLTLGPVLEHLLLLQGRTL